MAREEGDVMNGSVERKDSRKDNKRRPWPAFVTALVGAFVFFVSITVVSVFSRAVPIRLVGAAFFVSFFVLWPVILFFRFTHGSHEVKELDDPLRDYRESLKTDRMRQEIKVRDLNIAVTIFAVLLIFFFCTALPSPLADMLKYEMVNYGIFFAVGAAALFFFLKGMSAAYVLNRIDWTKCTSFKRQVELIDEVKHKWRRRGIHIRGESKSYINKISLYKTFLYLCASDTEVETMLAFIAMDKNDFAEKGFSNAETKIKWWPVLLDEMDKKVPYDFLRHELEKKEEKLDMEL